MRFIFVILFLWCNCLAGCSMKLDSPAEAFGVGSQRDRTITVSKNWFGAKASIPLTDLKFKGKATYNPDSGAFELDIDADQNFTNTMTVENARIKENQELFLAFTAAQKEVYEREIDALKDTVNHGFDAAGQALGFLARTPGGSGAAGGVISNIISSLGPEMVPMFLNALSKNGVPLALPGTP